MVGHTVQPITPSNMISYLDYTIASYMVSSQPFLRGTPPHPQTPILHRLSTSQMNRFSLHEIMSLLCLKPSDAHPVGQA